MKHLKTTAVVLRRVNYGEADRILTLLTPDFGKVALFAKGVRRLKSKLAGGIELMSESEISFIEGRTGMGTLVSTRLIRHFSYCAGDLSRMTIAARLLRRIDALTEERTSSEFYELTLEYLRALNTPRLDAALVNAWGTLRLLVLLGEGINLEDDVDGNPFREGSCYSFSFEHGRFVHDPRGDIPSQVIKLCRLMGVRPIEKLAGVRDASLYALRAEQLMDAIFRYNRPTTEVDRSGGQGDFLA